MKVLGQILRSSQALLHHDFCPWANRWVYWMKHPLAGIGGAALVALACGIFVNISALVLLGGLIFVAGLGTIWPWIAICGVSCEAEFLSPRCRVGGSVGVRLRITNRWPWPIWGLSVRRGFTEAAEESAGMALARINGWSSMDFEWPFRPHRRGIFPVAPPEVDTGFPFGLIHARAPIAMRGELIVWPISVALDAMPDVAEIHAREDRLAERRVGNCGDILGTRLFRNGDSLRRVHWIQTARFGRLIVTERQAPATCAVRLLVDVLARSHHTISGSHTLEQTLSVVASILESLHRHHAFVEVLLGDQRFEVGCASSDLHRCLDALARVPAAGVANPSAACLFDRPSRLLPTISVTTDISLSRHVRHPHRSAGERYVVITTAISEEEKVSRPSPRAGCDCHAWIEVPAQSVLKEFLPECWRRGCHVA